jgi:pimeloyl-ACP methyl ester carboxylesterase
MLSGRHRWIPLSLALGTGAAVLVGATVPASGSAIPVHGSGRSSASWLPPSAAFVSSLAARSVPYPAAGLAPSDTRFAGQALTWRGCIDRRTEPGLPRIYYRLQCSTVTAPLDWADPDGRTVTISVSRLRSTVRPAKGVLFTNPGGPGAAGAQLPLVLAEDRRTALLRSQDIYGIDVRGSGESTNATCGSTYGSGLDPMNRAEDNLQVLLDSAQLIARACDIAGGELIDHIDTRQTVRDLELLRSLIDAPTINWLGYSAGTWLGAQYATAFPNRVGHMVLDSNVDFTGTWQNAFEQQAAGFQRRFDADFVPWVATYSSLWMLGRTPAAVQASYRRIRAGLDPRLPVESPGDLDQLIAGSMYTKDLFPLAAAVLADLNMTVGGRLGDAQASRWGGARSGGARSAGQVRTAARARLAAEVPALRRSVLTPFSSDSEDAAFLAVTCNDTPWSGGRAGLVNTSARLGSDYPLIGWSTINQPCVFWGRPDEGFPLPAPDGAGVPRVLMVQSEHDPATPIEGARRAAAAFRGAQLLTVTDEGDHAIYASGNTCVNRAVERFIVSGVLPGFPRCPGRPLPDPRTVIVLPLRTAATPAAATPAATNPAATTPAEGSLGSPSNTAPTNPLLALRTLTPISP